MRIKSYLFTILALTLPLSALANDTVIFAADETDLKAFDQLIEQQKSGAGQPEKAPFGQAVRDEAHKLQEQGKNGNALGAWVRAQRANDKSSASTGSNRSSEVRSMVSDKKAEKAAGQGNPDKVNHGHH